MSLPNDCVVTYEHSGAGDSKCSECGAGGGAMFFLRRGVTILSAGYACDYNCAGSGLWKKYCVQRLQGKSLESDDSDGETSFDDYEGSWSDE